MTEKFRGWDAESERMIYDTEDTNIIPPYLKYFDGADFCRLTRNMNYVDSPYYVSGYKGELMRFVMLDKNDKETFVGDYI